MIELDSVVLGGVVEILNSMSSADRQQLGSKIEDIFRNHTRRKASPEFEVRVDTFSKKIRKMVESMRFGAEKDQIVLITNDFEDYTTLTYLTNGSEWFEGRDIGNDVLNFICNPSS